LNDEALFHFNGSVDRDFSVVVLYHSGLSRRYLSTVIRQVWCGVPFTTLKISGLYFFSRCHYKHKWECSLWYWHHI